MAQECVLVQCGVRRQLHTASRAAPGVRAMAETIAGLNVSILRWARESQGYTIEEVAAILKKSPDTVAAWEADDDEAAPTYVQLERLAYQIYNRPIAVFFLPSPPSEPNLKQEFRTLPDFEIDRLSADTRYHLRLARAFQLSLRELSEGANQAEHKVFEEVELARDSDPSEAADQIRAALGITLDVQRSWSSRDEALKKWRSAVEELGIFVFKNSFKQKEISGFCLTDEDFPIIYLNNSTAKARQIFSLFHELCHLLLRTNSITRFDDAYVDDLDQDERAAEQFCNRVTAEFLIPADDFSTQLQAVNEYDDETVERLADRYQVSREAILRRLLDLDLVGRDYYRTKADQWAQEAEDMPPRRGGNYYATHAAYLGQAYMGLVFSSYYRGKISLGQTADYLGVKSKSVAGLEALAVGGAQ